MCFLERLRAEITEIDEKIVSLISRRQELAVKIGKIKSERGQGIRDEIRARTVLSSAMRWADDKGIDPESIRRIFEIMIEMSEEIQREGEENLKKKGPDSSESESAEARYKKLNLQ